MRRILLMSVIGLWMLAGCGGSPSPTATLLVPPAPTTAPTSAPTASPDAVSPSPTPAPEAIDGVIAEGEYPFSTQANAITVWWRNDATTLTLAIAAPTTGWVAIGLDPVAGMEGANFLFATATPDGPRFMDAYGKRGGGLPHQPDTALGGSESFLAAAVTETNGATVAEFKIPLASGDAYDKTLQPGATVRFIAAYGRTDDFSSKHQAYGRGELTLTP